MFVTLIISVSVFKMEMTVFNEVKVVVELKAKKGKVVFFTVVNTPLLIKRF